MNEKPYYHEGIKTGTYTTGHIAKCTCGWSNETPTARIAQEAVRIHRDRLGH